jgi:hypothetical protein
MKLSLKRKTSCELVPLSSCGSPAYSFNLEAIPIRCQEYKSTSTQFYVYSCGVIFSGRRYCKLQLIIASFFYLPTSRALHATGISTEIFNKYPTHPSSHSRYSPSSLYTSPTAPGQQNSAVDSRNEADDRRPPCHPYLDSQSSIPPFPSQLRSAHQQ